MCFRDFDFIGVTGSPPKATTAIRTAAALPSILPPTPVTAATAKNRFVSSSYILANTF